jgi:hypothetical protein
MVKEPALSASLLSIAITACSLLTTPLAIRTAPAPSSICMAALGHGTVARNPDSGIGLLDADGKPVSVLWPFGFSGRIVEGRAVLLNEQGNILAREGDEITLGGGYGAGDRSFTACGGVTVDEPA